VNYKTNTTYRTSVILLLMVAAASVALARSATPPPAGARIYDTEWLNINKWKCPFYNDGRYGLDVTIGTGEAGGSWPQPFENKYIFGAGLWFGSLKPRSDDKVDTLVTMGYYPNSGGTEMTPVGSDHLSDGAGNPLDRIYVFPSDWPPPADRFGTDTSLVPQENFSLQDMWCVYSDLGEENHSAPGYPQGIDIYQTIYAWNYPTNQDIFFIVYKVRNSSDDTLKNCYMGACMDPDIGEHSDDMVGLLLNDTVPGAGLVQNVGYVGDNNNHEDPTSRGQWQEGTPGVVAYKFLESPRNPEDTTKPLGMTAFKKFTIDIDPPTDAAQYLTMAGYDYRTGVYAPYDSVDEAPADKRFIQCSGPFTMAPGQVEVLIVATIGAPYGADGQTWEARRATPDSLYHLASVANNAQFIYDQGWLLPGPPVSPGLTLVPGDNTVRVVWDNMPEVTPDPYYEKVSSKPWPSQGYDPKYKEYDFEGYIVYKSADGADWRILTQCDKADSVIFDYPPSGDSAVAESLWIRATDNGLSYSVVDDEVTNGYTYYYCVSAYDWNYVTTQWDTTQTPPVPVAWDTLILRSGIVANYSAVPRWNAPNYEEAMTEVVTVTGNADTLTQGMALTSKVVIPYQVEADTYEVRFLGSSYLAPNKSRYHYLITNLTTGEIEVDTAGFDYTVGSQISFSLPVFNGQETNLALDYDEPEVPFDTSYVETGSYPTENVRPARVVSGEQKALWCFRGSDYRIEWTTMPGSGLLTARVLDVTNGDLEVPTTKFDGRDGSKADGWCFVNRIGQKPTDTLTTGATFLYLCGGYIALNSDGTSNDSIGSMMSQVQDGDVWMAIGHKKEKTAAYYNVFHLVSTPAREGTETLDSLVVKVVPNPYIVYNAWEANSDNRRIKFTHLPMTCTIRIFSLSGDLVKVLEHQDDPDHPLDVGGTETWDLLNDNYQLVASGVYVFNVESPVGDYTGKFALIH